MTANAVPLNEHELARSALVVAPHPDDESLGCGGTILRKRGLAATVTIAFLTDGSHSHERQVNPADMRVRRRAEALRAAAALDVPESDVVFFDIEDTQLATNERLATEGLRALIRERRPVEVFLPSRFEMPADHRAAYRAGLAAIRATRCRTTIREYPVWLWQHFPWARAENYVGRSPLIRARAALRANQRLLAGFRTRCEIAPVLEGKRRALAAHASQMTGIAGHEHWPTLHDVSSGEFAACFDRDREFFETSEVNPDE
ncbi:MAG TPA: PIG-L deacetylase family protein [Candidatus Binatia bacterium]|nr:PIG-L deacetylase family protein [Candidatus Binatia bacterium]